MNNALESKTYLTQLKLTALLILSAANAVETKTLFGKIGFVITDKMAHNFNVEAEVAEHLGSEKMPDQLFSDVHPSLKFNRVIVKHWDEFERATGLDVIRFIPTFLLIPQPVQVVSLNKRLTPLQDY